MGLKGCPIRVQEVTAVDKTAHAIVYPRNIAIIHILTSMAQ